MSRDQRERHLKKVAQGNVIKEVNQIACQLPVPPEKFHTGLKLPLSAIQGIWKEASELGVILLPSLLHLAMALNVEWL